MPRYEHNPTTSHITLAQLPKGTYQVQLGEPKAWIRAANPEKQTKEQYGIRYGITVTSDGEHKGKRQMIQFDYTNEWGQAFGKQLVMAALGYTLDEASEDKFNADYADKDWSFDPETGAVGDVYREVTGKNIMVDTDIAIAKDGSGKQFVQFSGYKPIS